MQSVSIVDTRPDEATFFKQLLMTGGTAPRLLSALYHREATGAQDIAVALAEPRLMLSAEFIFALAVCPHGRRGGGGYSVALDSKMRPSKVLGTCRSVSASANRTANRVPTRGAICEFSSSSF